MKMFNGFQQLTIFAKRSILDILQGSENTALRLEVFLKNRCSEHFGKILKKARVLESSYSKIASCRTQDDCFWLLLSSEVLI